MTTIQLRRGTAADWTAANTLLAAGEIGIELDTGKFKRGDGITPWANLDYYISEPLIVAQIDAKVSTAVSDHENKADPHPIYLTAEEGTAAYEAVGTMAAHLANNDPHPVYLVPTEIVEGTNISIDTTTIPGSVIITASYDGVMPEPDHGKLSGLGDDDHPQYFLANGSRPAEKVMMTGPMAIVSQADDLAIYSGQLCFVFTDYAGARYADLAIEDLWAAAGTFTGWVQGDASVFPNGVTALNGGFATNLGFYFQSNNNLILAWNRDYFMTNAQINAFEDMWMGYSIQDNQLVVASLQNNALFATWLNLYFAITDLTGAVYASMAGHWLGPATRTLMSNQSRMREALPLIERLKPVWYSQADRKGKIQPTTRRKLGLVADEVASVLPGAVERPLGPNADELIDYAQITTLLVKTVQEQQEQIRSLEARLTALETSV